jgi:hypothetical protein
MRRHRRITVSTAVTGGVLGIAGMAIAAVPEIATATAGGPAPDRTAAEREGLQKTLSSVEARTGALSAQLAAARRQLDAARAAAARVVATPQVTHPTAPSGGSVSTRTRVVYVHASPSPSPTPSTHTTTGASGSAGGDDGSGDGGDGGGGDD